VTRHINLTSPFTIAYGRLFGLRLPLTITLAVKRRPARLLAGVILSSIMWDGLYITVGATVGKTATLNPVQVLLGSVGGLTLLYLVTFLVRRWLKRRQLASN
jgi:membrane protein DedA with SNARE-associated domain